MKDLFGQDVPDTVHALTPSESKRRRKPTRKRGYVMPPGTGPKGETCKSCKHKVTYGMRSGRSFVKCGLMRDRWTHGPGSDIYASAPACQKWEKKDGK